MTDGREAKPHEVRASRTNPRDCSSLRTLTDVHETLRLSTSRQLDVLVYVTLTGSCLCKRIIIHICIRTDFKLEGEFDPCNLMHCLPELFCMRVQLNSS